jgi:hypothetical protein
MLKRILGITVTISSTEFIALCLSMSEYERHVKNWRLVYCYKLVGRVQSAIFVGTSSK